MTGRLIYLTLLIGQLYLANASSSDIDFLMNHYHTEESNFSCESVKDGIYADVDSACRKFFVCEKTVKYHFSCPDGMRFFQRFETCSFVPADEEATFNCNEQVTQEARSGKSQALESDEITEDTEAHNMERRDDGLNEENVDETVDANEQREETEPSEPVYISHRSMIEPPAQYARSSSDLLSQLSFLSEPQGPSYLMYDQEAPRAIEERESVDEETPVEQEPAHADEAPFQHQGTRYTLCTIANVRSRRELRCL